MKYSVHIGRSWNPRKRFRDSEQISTETKLLLTFIKLKHNFEFKKIEDLFHIKRNYCRTVFENVLDAMKSNGLTKPAWKNREQIAETIPKQFKEMFPNNYVILRKVKFKGSLSKRTLENRSTLTGIICTDPYGCIMFVSKFFEGSISNKDLFDKSGLLKEMKNCLERGELKTGDSILIGNLTDIGHEITGLGLEVNTCSFPPVDTSMKCNGEKNTNDVMIYQALSRSERAISILKDFEVLKEPFASGLIGKFDEIFSACCFLTNMHLDAETDRQYNVMETRNG